MKPFEKKLKAHNDHMNVPRRILIHCTDVSAALVPDQYKSVNAYHRDVRGFPRSILGIYVGYHDLITGGKIYHCRDYHEEGAHCNQILDGESMNLQSIGLCIGFDGDIEYPPPVEYKLLKQKVHELMHAYNIPAERVQFHRVYATDKTCPGLLIDQKWLNDLTALTPVPSLEKQEKINQILATQKTLMEQTIVLLQQLVEKLRAELLKVLAK